MCAAVFVLLYAIVKECRLCHSSFSLGCLPRGLDFFPLKFFSFCLSRSPLARKRFHGHIAVAKVTLPTDPPPFSFSFSSFFSLPFCALGAIFFFSCVPSSSNTPSSSLLDFRSRWLPPDRQSELKGASLSAQRPRGGITFFRH